MRICEICGKSRKEYVKIKSGNLLCKKCAGKYPDSLIKRINEIPFKVVKDMAYNHIRPYPKKDVTAFDIYSSLVLDMTNGRLRISNSWIRTAGISSAYFQFFPVEETKDSVTGRVALIIHLRAIPALISEEISMVTISKESFVNNNFPWNCFNEELNDSIAMHKNEFSFRHFYNKKKGEKQRQQKKCTSYNDIYKDALAFFKLSENYTMQELRSARNKAQRTVHPDNNGGSKDFARMEELSKLANQYYDILKKHLKN